MFTRTAETLPAEADRISFCLHGTVLELIRNGSKIEPTPTEAGAVLNPFESVPDRFQNGQV